MPSVRALACAMALVVGSWMLAGAARAAECDSFACLDRAVQAGSLDHTESKRIAKRILDGMPEAERRYAAYRDHLSVRRYFPLCDKFLFSGPKSLEIFALDQLARKGVPDATIVRPPNFDRNLKYPIYLATYSGPDAPSVRNSFRANPWHQFLAQRGAMVLQVNVRSASGRGQAHTGECYKQLGVRELQDLEDAIDHICEKFSGDPERVAIDGWSYGGFMAAYALTHSDKFAVGIAGAGVHDWRLYDTIYTERYMSTPQLNPEGYDATSVIKAADNLDGHLVILHGARDDNVHLQNTMQLIYALQQAGKDDFELMLYPRSRHGVRGSHHRRLIWRALQEHLGLSEN